MNSVLTKISAIKRNPNNPRILKDDKFAKLTQSIKDFPQMLEIRPIVVNDDMIVLGGNMRLKACKEAGLSEVPVIKAADLTEEQQREFIIKDNVGFGEWDWDLLANDWDADLLDDWGLDIDFASDDNEGLTDEDDVPEVTETPVSKVGDIWLLGEHRVMCGSSTDGGSVALLMNGSIADMVFTDPPYNVDYGNSNNPQHKSRTILNDKKSDADWDEFVREYMTNLLLFTNGNFYISMSDKELGHMQKMFEECGGRWASFIIWVKDRLVLSGKDYHSRHETILYGWNEKIENRLRVEDRKQDDVWEIKRPTTSDLHPTMKPIELIERMLNNSSRDGHLILDLFLGSGSTLIASEKKGRKCYGMELDPKYVDVIIKRWQEYTGKKAIHAETGDEFIEVSND